MRKTIIIAGLLALALLMMAPGVTLYYESGEGTGCTKCHEMNSPYDLWHTSSHRETACPECHGGAFTMDAAEWARILYDLAAAFHHCQGNRQGQRDRDPESGRCQ